MVPTQLQWCGEMPGHLPRTPLGLTPSILPASEGRVKRHIMGGGDQASPWTPTSDASVTKCPVSVHILHGNHGLGPKVLMGKQTEQLCIRFPKVRISFGSITPRSSRSTTKPLLSKVRPKHHPETTPLAGPGLFGHGHQAHPSIGMRYVIY